MNTTTTTPTKKTKNAKTKAAKAESAPAAATGDHTPVNEMKLLGTKAIGLCTQIRALFPKLVSMTEEDRKLSPGKFRLGELEALTAVIKATAAFPQYFAALGDQDFGDDPSTFESQLLLDRIARREVLVSVAAALHEAATLFDDTVLKVGEVIRSPALAAYQVAAPLAKSNAQLRTKLQPALVFYGKLGKKSARTRKKNKASKKVLAS